MTPTIVGITYFGKGGLVDRNKTLVTLQAQIIFILFTAVYILFSQLLEITVQAKLEHTVSLILISEFYLSSSFFTS